MSPEQFDGFADHRSDQYSYCALAWEAINGEPFRRGESIEALRLAAVQPPSKSALRRRNVPPAVLDVLAKGLQPEPDARFEDMDALVAALARAASPRKMKRTIAAVSLVAVAVVIGAATLGYRSDRINRTCAAEASRLDAIATTARLNRLAEQMSDEDATRLRSVMKERKQQWRNDSLASCRSTRIDGTQSERLYRRRSDCLQDILTETGAWLEALEGTTSPKIGRTDSILTDVRTCGDINWLLSRPKLPSDPSTRRAIDDIRARMTSARVRSRLGYREEGIRTTVKIHEDAMALGFVPLQIETAVMLGWNFDSDPAGEPYLQWAAQAALEHKYLDQAGLAWMHQAVMTAMQGDNVGALRLLGLAESVFRGLPSRRHERGQVLARQAFVNHQLGQFREAMKQHEAAYALIGPEVHPGIVGDHHFHIARLWFDWGHYPLAWLHLEAAARNYKATDDRSFGQLSQALRMQARVLIAVRAAQSAVETLTEAERLHEYLSEGETKDRRDLDLLFAIAYLHLNRTGLADERLSAVRKNTAPSWSFYERSDLVMVDALSHWRRQDIDGALRIVDEAVRRETAGKTRCGVGCLALMTLNTRILAAERRWQALGPALDRRRAATLSLFGENHPSLSEVGRFERALADQTAPKLSSLPPTYGNDYYRLSDTTRAFLDAHRAELPRSLRASD